MQIPAEDMVILPVIEGLEFDPETGHPTIFTLALIVKSSVIADLRNTVSPADAADIADAIVEYVPRDPSVVLLSTTN